jgi:hypothetical protein
MPPTNGIGIRACPMIAPETKEVEIPNVDVKDL